MDILDELKPNKSTWMRLGYNDLEAEQLETLSKFNSADIAIYNSIEDASEPLVKAILEQLKE